MRKWMVSLAVVLAVALVAAGPALAGEKVRLTWSSGGTGGGWFVMAAGMAKIIEEKAPNLQLNVVPGGGTNNQPIVAAKKADLGWGLPPFVMAAYKGQDPYDKPMPDLRSLGGSFSDQSMHIMAAEDTGVKTVQEFVNYAKPIRVGPGKVGVSGEWSLVKALKFYKSSYDEIKKKGGKVLFTGYTEIATNLQDRHIDFAAINIAPPASIVQEASLGRKLRLLPFPEDLRKFMKDEFSFSYDTIRKASYPGVLTADIPTVGMGTDIIVHKDMSDDVAYTLTKLCNEMKDRLPAIHKSMEVFDPTIAWKDRPVPLHPGAAKYYKEKGYMK
ncbi:MAG: TAXI family TRAP transporter solute-binding subunit [Candidatus Methylomirabilota bacterium]